MSTPHYKFKTGETVALNLSIEDINAGPISSVSAKIKKAGPNGSLVQDNPVLTTMTVTSTIGGYIISTNNILPIGIYVLDAKIIFVNNSVSITDTLIIQIEPSVT